MRSLSLILFLLLTQSVFATLAEKEGYYVTMAGDTVSGTIKVRIDYLEELYYARIQYGAFFEDSTGQLIPLKPEEIQAFSFFHKYEHIKFVSQEYYNNFRIFLKVIIEGDGADLYVHFKNVVDTRTDFGSLAFYLLEYPASSEQDQFFIVKHDGSSIKYSKYSGRKNIALFFSDFPALNNKIKRGLYGYTAVYKMIREYNQWYASNN